MIAPEHTEDNNHQPRLDELLSPKHLAMLRDESGISDDVILARGYRTIETSKEGRAELIALGFKSYQCRVPGLLLPLHTTDGKDTLPVFRSDNPRVRENKKKKLPDGTHPCKLIKYEMPSGSGVRVDCTPVCQPMLGNPSIPLWITEGQKKGDALASRGLCAIALLGVWNFKGRNQWGGTTLLADFDHISWRDRKVRIVFDSDVITKPQVQKALERFTEHLQRKGARVAQVYLPDGDNAKVGVDDWLAAGHTVAELNELVRAPQPEVKAAPPTVELLDSLPPTMSRPLTLIDGRAYAAAWLPVRVTTREMTDRHGRVIELKPPEVEHTIRLFVVRDDGLVFGEGGDRPFEDLGIEVHLPEIPRPDRTWSTAGVNAYREGYRPDPVVVFNQVADVVDRFIDFNRSLADQRTMAEMAACYAVATWFLDAFTVIGFLWPNGDRGSGKTQLLTVIGAMSYLGHVILAGGSYAALRDLADYGATLAFDDAENLSDIKRSDPDKRALLLAGNRRGNTVPLKEPGPDRTWRTRHVNTYCPRLFSAIQLPDYVLASRTIIIPLIRTANRHKANADPLDYEEWPHDHQQIVDDLWAVALAHLPEMSQHERAVNADARLAGRNLEPWRAILAVAHWLDAQGATGLWDRMEELSVKYQDERPDLEYGDLTSLVIGALCANCAKRANCANPVGDSHEFVVTARQIKDEAHIIIENEDSDFDSTYVTTQRVGMALKKMRLRKPPRPGGKGPRKWAVTIDDLQRWTLAYGLPLPEELVQLVNTPTLQTPSSNEVGTVGTPGPVGTQDDGDETNHTTNDTELNEAGREIFEI